MGQASLEPEVRIDARMLREAMAEFIEFAGTGGAALVFSIGYNYGKRVAERELSEGPVKLRDVLRVVRSWSKVSVKVEQGGEVLVVGSDDPFTVGFVSGCVSRVAEDLRVHYENSRALIALKLKEGTADRSKIFSLLSILT